MIFTLILAHDESRCLGKDGGLAWSNSEDLKHFKESTKGHTVIMGRKTFDSIGKALPDRRNIVLSRNSDSIKGAEVFDSIESILASFENTDMGRVFVIGGAEIYRQFLERDLADELWISHIPGTHEGDVYFPFYTNKFEPFYEKQFSSFDFIKYRRINSRNSSSK
ncbi:MAG: dihydrofolate reductase [Patescibacteria group bacterium]